MDPDRLYPSIYGEDEKRYDIWTKEIGVPGEKITRFYRDENGECDNFWEHGAGPCGPSVQRSIMIAVKNTAVESRIVRSAASVTALWRSGIMYLPSLMGMVKVAMTELENKNIDTGMGLERLGCCCTGCRFRI